MASRVKAIRSYRLRIGSCSRRFRRGEATVPLPHCGRNVGDFVPLQFPAVNRPADLVKGFQEERPHEERLQPPRLGPLHFFFHSEEPVRRHRFLGECVPVEQGL